MTFDFDGIKTELRQRLSLLSDWATTLYFGVYERILDVIAYITEKMVYLAEWYYKEANWQTATQLESLLEKAKWLCYRPHRKKGAYGEIILSADPVMSIAYVYNGPTIIIPKWTVFTNKSGDIFVYSTKRYVYSNNYVGNLKIAVKEGIPTEYLYIAEGIQNEEIKLFFNNIDNDEIEVEIVNANNEKIYSVGICGVDEPTGEIILVNDLNNYWCQIDNANDFQSIKIIFGDGIRNKKLNPGERVLIKFVKTKGKEGNISNIGVITTIQNTLYSTAGTKAILYVKNIEEISDGSDIEDIEEIRINAPQLFQSGYRAGSKHDWESILNSISYINKAKVWSAYDEGDDTALNANKVYICAVTTDGTDLTTIQKTTLSQTLKNYKTPTEIISFHNLEKIYILFTINASVTNTPEFELNNIVFETLKNAYGVLNTNFQTNIYQSNYISLIDSLEDISFHETTAEYVQKGISYAETNLRLTACINAMNEEDDVLLTSGSVKLWIQRKIDDEWVSGAIQIAETNTDDNISLIGINDYVIASGSLIDYNNFRISFIVSNIAENPPAYGVENPSEADPFGYVLSVSYKTQDGCGNHINDVRLGRQTNITDIDKDFIFTNYTYE